jgi:ubiquinone/menaquinone biosynthesis C-methylase UbiE
MHQAFDIIANQYDELFTHSAIGIAQRNLVWGYLEKLLAHRNELNILELNCGTGEDALWFARKGHKIIATDISNNMLQITKEKISNAGLINNVKIIQADISKIETAGINEKFDLIFSNFGGINCISSDELNKLSSDIKNLLKAAGQLVMVIMPAFCAWETLYFILKFNFKKAFRRLSAKGEVVKFNGENLITYYYSVARIKKSFGQNFNLVAVKPIGFFIPPSYMEKFFHSKPKFFNILKKLEHSISKFDFLAGFSDHFLINLQVK